MMKITEKMVTLMGVSTIDGVDAAGFQAGINSSDPLTVSWASWVSDPTVYKGNIETCRQDEDAFRERVQKMQDEMIAAQELALEQIAEV